MCTEVACVAGMLLPAAKPPVVAASGLPFWLSSAVGTGAEACLAVWPYACEHGAALLPRLPALPTAPLPADPHCSLPRCPAYPALLTVPPCRSLHMRPWASLCAPRWTWRRCWRALVRAASCTTLAAPAVGPGAALEAVQPLGRQVIDQAQPAGISALALLPFMPAEDKEQRQAKLAEHSFEVGCCGPGAARIARGGRPPRCRPQASAMWKPLLD